MRLRNKCAIITAAASGMGRAGVEVFCREGARVAAIDINADALAALAGDLRRRGVEVETVQADLADAAHARAAIEEATRRLGGVDGLWAHAGSPGPGDVERLDLPAYQAAIALNVTSAIVSAGAVVGSMRERGGGSILFTASVSGLVGSMFSPIYSAAKFAVVGLGKSLALKYAKDGIRVNVLCPGLADTPMKSAFTSRTGDPEEAVRNEERLIATVPMGRLCRASEVADAALWLASDEASCVTGVALPIDGGYTAR
jgi:NAD(P)-dependent dehydrogenase (short-subunit alcohol dehydrogenase family)